jgi:hypothetical protein
MLHSEKTIKTLCGLIGKNVVATFRSSPETIIRGVFSSFDFTETERVIAIDCDHHGQFAVLNWDDVSIIKMETYQ